MKTKKFFGILLGIIIFFSNTIYAGTGTFPNSTFSNLDYGLYWFDYNDGWMKAIPGQSNACYDKNKPTIIYIHGWQKDTVARKFRESFDQTEAGGPEVDLAQAWLNKGWNVGILYWNQFADEVEVKDAEAKIWSVNGPKGMRWRDSSGNYNNGPSKNAGQLLYESLKDNMGDFNGSELRIAGHSLGNQMAIVVAKKIQTNIGSINSKLKPKRIALLDPYYSNGAKDYIGNKWTGELSREYVQNLKDWGVIFEAYRSSSVTNTIFVGDANTDLMKKTAFVELKPWYFQSWQQAEKHQAGMWHYFYSFAFSAPKISGSSSDAMSASTSNSRATTIMKGTKKMVHDTGAYTKTPSDDSFKSNNR
ncbi:MAG: hypothetical protein H7A23_21745 [Leptospiraceae bacterium]|nr:hypothetical protein [Leptospiraceae bacterium]MCP5497185.1 hypothetical protein [Leptospiraceae bacterium]